MAAEITDPLQLAADEVIVAWPGVKAKGVFGHRGYVRDGKMFAFLVPEGLAVKATDDGTAADLFGREGVRAFEYNSMPMRAWAILPLKGEADLAEVLSLARRSFEGVG